MMDKSILILTTSPQSQPAGKSCKTANLALGQRPLYGRKQHSHAVKERDSETGLYYYGARYLDSKTSRWLSGDPAMGDYIPSAPVNDEARKRNGNLPGMGGVFNYVNLHVYHYAGNNPVIYIDPDGNMLWRQFGIGLTQTIGGIVAVAGGAALTTGSSGIALTGGIMAITWGTKEAMDGVGKMVNAIFDNEYGGMLPLVAETIAKNNGADPETQQQVEAIVGGVESAIGFATPGGKAGMVLSGINTASAVCDIVDAYNSSTELQNKPIE